MPQRVRQLIGDLEHPAVLASEMHRHDGGAGRAHDLVGEDVPLRLNRGAPPAFGHCHLAGWKQNDHTARAQVLHGVVPHLQSQLAGVFLMREGNRDHEFLNLGNSGQQAARQNLEIRPHPVDQLGHHHAIHQPRGVVGHHDHRTGGGDAGNFLIRGINPDPHMVDCLGPERRPKGRARLFKAADQAQKLHLRGQPL